ncbi:haloacid dehalogenase-like hydrolase [Luteibacter sp. CQ10]|uniref:haloacid dehalogenase-like hydrolase n=1 Tax=Luteibacter sp. CQ10 TaxID=2805821 RepID=UPI0034A1F574
MTQGMDAAATDIAADARRVALFDFDGVIVRHQTLELYFRECLKGFGRWRLLLALPLVPFVPVLLPSVGGNRFLGRVFLRVVTFGRSEASYRRKVTAFARAYARRPGVFVRDAVATLRRHLDAGDRVVIVTGNDATLVQAILDEVNLAGCELLASRTKGGLFGVRFVVHNVDGVKPVSVQRAGIARPCAVAYGDSLSDLPLLRIADAPKLVNAHPKTVKKMRKLLGERLETLDWF